MSFFYVSIAVKVYCYKEIKWFCLDTNHGVMYHLFIMDTYFIDREGEKWGNNARSEVETKLIKKRGRDGAMTDVIFV